MNKQNGGPAYPTTTKEHGWSSDPFATPISVTHTGLTIRDYFAGQALARILGDPTCVENPKLLAVAAYLIADAMLRAREQEADNG